MGLSHSPSIVTDGLVLCLDAANARSYPGTGTTWTDLKGGNNGTLINMDASNFSPDNGGSLTFDGTNEKVNCGTFLSDEQSALSICVWFKPHYIPPVSTAFRLVSRFVGTGNISGRILFDTYGGLGQSSGVRFVATASNGKVYSATAPSVLETKWLFYVGTYSQADSKIKVYKNAQEQASGNASGTIGAYNYPWTIGEDNTTTGDNEWFDGNLSSVSIYNRALSAGEIRQNYLATKGRYE